MKEHDKLELSERSRPNGNAGGAWESRVVKFTDSYEILDPQEAPDFRGYARILRKRMPTVLIVFTILFSISLIATLKQKPVYRAQVLLEIQKENPDIPTIQELYELDSVSDAYLRSQYTILGSESLARSVIDKLRLDTVGEFNAPEWWSWRWRKKKNVDAPQVFAAGPARADREVYRRVLERFRDRLQIDPINRSRLVNIQFDSHDPALAARVANSLAENYIEQNLQARWTATQKAADWLSQQLSGVKARLEKSEEHLQDYARRNDLVFLESDKEPSRNVENEQVQQLQEELTKAEAQRYEKEALYRVVESGDYEHLPGEFESKVIQDLTERLAELKREHAKLSTTFNADYPRVKEIQSQIDEIAAAIQEQRKDAASQINSDYFAAVGRENLVRDALHQEQKQLNQVAARAVQYNILKREVDTNKQLYEGLLQRLKEASVSASLKASNIRIVDAAEPPTNPVSPKIPLNLGVAAIFGLGLGFCAAFLQERLDDTLKGTEDVERLFGLSAVGLIPAVPQLNGNHHSVSKLLEHAKVLSRKENGNGRRPALAWHRIDEEAKQNPALAEAFRSLRTSILLSTADHPQFFAGHQHATRRGQDHHRHQPVHCSRTTRPASLARGCRFALTFVAPALRCAGKPWLGQLPHRSPGLAYRRAPLGMPWPRSPVLRAHTSQSIGTSLVPKHGRINSFRAGTIPVCHSRFRAHAGPRGQPHSRHACKRRPLGGEKRDDSPRTGKAGAIWHSQRGCKCDRCGVEQS